MAQTKERIKQFYKMRLSVPTMSVPTIIKTVEKISSQLSGTPKSPSPFEIEETYIRLLEALNNNTLSRVDPRDWKIGTYALWYGDQKLGGNIEFLESYLKWLNENSLPSNWRRLIYVYLKDFNYRLDFPKSFIIISRAIISALAKENLKRRLEKWNDRHNKIELFSENFSLKKAANTFSNESKNDWNTFINLTGLDGELGFSGYAEAVGVQLLNRLVSNPSAENFLSVQKYHSNDNKLRFNEKRPLIIETMLSPWINHPTLPNDEIRKNVQEWLLVNFNDPRLPIHRERGWRSVGDPSLQLMYRWLVGESLDQFFAIIDELALEHQWKYRKAFWKAYHNNGSLDEAWVALGPDAKYYAKNIFGSNLSAGELEAVSQGNQSVLIVKIRDLVLAEWSHNGKCRAWKVEDKLCPSVYKMKYSGNELKAPSMKIVQTHQLDGISHQGSENYFWQRKLADFIFEQTGTRIQQRDFRI